MSSIRRQSGFSLIEVLLAMTLSLLILGATLAVFSTAERGHRDNQRQNEAQDQVRFATDSLARRLRNLASPTDSATPLQPIELQPIERATATDLIFRSVNSEGPANPDPDNPHNLEHYRYCLGTNGKLYVQRQTWSATAPGFPTGPGCPAGGWSESRVAAESITNVAGPVFNYVLSTASGFSEKTSVAQADFASVVAIGTHLVVDPLPNMPPKESSLTTRVFLRNQNRAPSPSFTAVLVTGTTFQLNATSSDDPEGERLRFSWVVDNSPRPDLDDNARPTVTFTTPPSQHSVYLKVTDVGNLTVKSETGTTNCTTTCTPFSFTP